MGTMLKRMFSVRLRAKTCGTGLAFVLAAVAAAAQIPAGDAPVAMGAGRMVRGTVTAATADHLTVKTEAGDVYDVVVTANTQVRKGRDPMKLADVHPGDAIGAMGEIDAPKKTVHALFVQVVDAEQVKKAREAMGKTFIAGTVTAVDELKLTIKRTDDVVQVIAVDEDTSFRRGNRNMAMALAADGTGGTGGGMAGGGRRGGTQAAAPAADNAESLTLADIKVGSVVAGPGTLKNGVFVPTTLSIADPAAGRQRRRPDGAAPQGPPPSGTPPPPGR